VKEYIEWNIVYFDSVMLMRGGDFWMTGVSGGRTGRKMGVFVKLWWCWVCAYVIMLVIIVSASKHKDTVAEWLRRLTRNQLGLSRVGSSPTSVELFTPVNILPKIHQQAPHPPN
jgi:hypothetical protein